MRPAVPGCTRLCQRDAAQNRIKQAQVELFATRTSCHALRSNRLRMLLAAPGYVLIERLRALALQSAWTKRVFD